MNRNEKRESIKVEQGWEMKELSKKMNKEHLELQKEWEEDKVNYNELELFLIRLTGSKENVYKTKLVFMTISDFVAGKIIQIGNRYLLIDENIKGKSRKVILDTNQVIDIKIK